MKTYAKAACIHVHVSHEYRIPPAAHWRLVNRINNYGVSRKGFVFNTHNLINIMKKLDTGSILIVISKKKIPVPPFQALYCWICGIERKKT